LDERELVRKILQGDEEAQILFYVTHRERLFRNCAFLLGHHDHEAEDVVQEAFLAAFRLMDQFEFRSSLGTWLTQIGIHLCFNRFRRRAKTLAHDQADLDGLMSAAAVRKGESQAEKDEKQAKLRLVEKCLEKIGPECREIVRLRDFDGLAYADIGLALRMPMGTVMSRLSRCKQALKALVQQALAGE
jgi:RNA polymerase sigma-70 factor (ECF subfamily)